MTENSQPAELHDSQEQIPASDTAAEGFVFEALVEEPIEPHVISDTITPATPEPVAAVTSSTAAPVDTGAFRTMLRGFLVVLGIGQDLGAKSWAWIQKQPIYQQLPRTKKGVFNLCCVVWFVLSTSWFAVSSVRSMAFGAVPVKAVTATQASEADAVPAVIAQTTAKVAEPILMPVGTNNGPEILRLGDAMYESVIRLDGDLAAMLTSVEHTRTSNGCRVGMTTLLNPGGYLEVHLVADCDQRSLIDPVVASLRRHIAANGGPKLIKFEVTHVGIRRSAPSFRPNAPVTSASELVSVTR